MSEAQQASPIACRIDALSPDERTRRSEVVDLIRATLYRRSETEDGIVFQWASEEHLPALIGEFVALESRCCPFIRFTMDVEAERGRVSLRLGGREGVKEFLQVAFPAVE